MDDDVAVEELHEVGWLLVLHDADLHRRSAAVVENLLLQHGVETEQERGPPVRSHASIALVPGR